MDQSSGEGTITTSPITVDVASVDGELANIWLKATEGTLQGVSAPVSRVLLSNLLVYATTDAKAAEARSVVKEIAADHPARVVIADAQTAETSGELKAEVSMICNITERGRRLCGEEITLHPHNVASAALGSILPVLAPDLPIYLWTPGALLPDDQLLVELTHIADHWIVDSRRFTNWPEDIGRVLELGPHHEPPITLHDLSWTSLGQWRELVAQFFDSQSTRVYLRGVTRVIIEHKPSAGSVPPVESVFMAAWLIAQLNWRDPKVSSKSGGWRITASDDNDVSIDLVPNPNAYQSIHSIEIESTVDGQNGVFKAQPADSSPNEIYLESNTADIPSIGRTVTMDPNTTATALLEALNTSGIDTLYYRALPIIETLMREIIGR